MSSARGSHRKAVLPAAKRSDDGLTLLSLGAAAGLRIRRQHYFRSTTRGPLAVPGQSGDTEQIVFQTKTGTVGNPAVESQITAALGQVSHLPYVSSVTSPYSPAGAQQVSAGKNVAFASVNFTVAASSVPAAEATEFVNLARSPNQSDACPCAVRSALLRRHTPAIWLLMAIAPVVFPESFLPCVPTPDSRRENPCL
jgi:hypothetical protein